MSDPRFARLKTDPRFRKPKKHQSKVTVDARFSTLLERPGPNTHAATHVDKYGRRTAKERSETVLRRFYCAEELSPNAAAAAGPDYARGEALLESSDDDSEHSITRNVGDDLDAVTVLGASNGDNFDAEIDFDEESLAPLDARQAATLHSHLDSNAHAESSNSTRRIAVVNLDWDHVRAAHLFKICESVLDAAATQSNTTVTGRKVLSVHVFPSQFGKERLDREESNGPPLELYRKKHKTVDDADAVDMHEIGDAEKFDEDALRRYQLERLRYYYAIIQCDDAQTAQHLYSELQGTELERSANVFDLSFVPDGMEFGDDWRDKATSSEMSLDYKPLDYVTDALRHSRVKLTWDEDDPERRQFTRRVLTKEDIENSNFRAYIASSSESDLDHEDDQGRHKLKREKIRHLLLGANNDNHSLAWDDSGIEKNASDMDMEVTFMPALSVKPDDDETTRGKYTKRIRERRKKNNRKRQIEDGSPDEFFVENTSKTMGSSSPMRGEVKESLPAVESQHFDMKAILRVEKGGRAHASRNRDQDEQNELQTGFSMNIHDERFQAVHEDHNFAIDPSNPQFKKTTSMSALLAERTKRRKGAENIGKSKSTEKSTRAEDTLRLRSLVDRAKQKSKRSR